MKNWNFNLKVDQENWTLRVYDENPFIMSETSKGKLRIKQPQKSNTNRVPDIIVGYQQSFRISAGVYANVLDFFVRTTWPGMMLQYCNDGGDTPVAVECSIQKA
jgi:hypothetical protein